jgi:hypothetical protein
MFSIFSKKFGALQDRIRKDDLNYFEEQFMYGHREIILNYILSSGHNISSNSYLQGGIAHGWAPNFEVWRLRKKNFRRANRYVWKSPNFTSEDTIYNQIPIGAPWLYLLLTLGITPGSKIEMPIKDNRENLIMPYHSEGVRLKKINEQAEHFRQIVDPTRSTVCLFWLDYCDPVNRAAYSDLGFNVECVGYPNRVTNSYLIGGPRTLFLVHLLSLMLEHRTLITDNPSTSLFYAASLGKTVVIAEDKIAKDFVTIFDSFIRKYHVDDVGTNAEWLARNFEYTKPGADNLKNLNLKAWDELGFQNIQKPSELINLDWKTSTKIPDHLAEFNFKLKKTFSNMQVSSI